MATTFLREKLHVAQNSVRDAEMQIFACQMTVEESAAVPEDKALQAQAANSLVQKVLWEKKIKFRREQVAKLEAELKALTPPVPPIP